MRNETGGRADGGGSVSEKLEGQIVNDRWEMKPSEKLKQYGWTVTIPVSVYPDGNGLDVEVGDRLIVIKDGIEYECLCRGWKLQQPLSENRYVIKTTLIDTKWPGNYEAPIEDVRIIITRREAILRGLISTPKITSEAS
jgi:hypothetical protein